MNSQGRSRPNILSTLFSISSLSLVSYCIGFFNQIIISRHFGTQPELDVYYFVLSIMNVGTFFAGPVNEAAIPHFFKLMEQDSDEASRYFSSVVNTLLLSSLLICAILAFGVPLYGPVLAGDVYANNKTLFLLFAFLLAPSSLLNAYLHFFSSVLNSCNKFMIQTLTRTLGAVVNLIVLLLFTESVGVYTLGVAFVLGLVLNVGLQWRQIQRLGIRYHFKAPLRFDRTFYSIVGGLSGTYLLSALYPVFEQRVLSEFGAGVIAAYSYARTLHVIPQQLLFVGVVNMVWTRVMENLSRADLSTSYLDMSRISTASLWVSGLFAVFYACFNQEIIYVLFFRGEFGPESLAKSSYILRYLGLSLPLLILTSLTGRMITALRRSRQLVVLSLMDSLLKVVFAVVAILQKNMLLLILAPAGAHLIILATSQWFLARSLPDARLVWRRMGIYLLLGLALAALAWPLSQLSGMVGENKMLIVVKLTGLFILCLVPLAGWMLWVYKRRGRV